MANIQPFFARRRPTAEVGAARMDYPGYQAAKQYAGMGELGQAFGATGELAEKRINTIVQSEFTTGKADWETAHMTFEEGLRADPDYGNYLKKYEQYTKRIQKNILAKATTGGAKKALSQMFEQMTPSVKESIGNYAWSKKKSAMGAELLVAVRKHELAGSAAKAEAALIEGVGAGIIAADVAAGRALQVKGNVEYFAGVYLAEHNPEALLGVIDTPEYYENLNEAQKAELRGRARSSQARIMKTRQSEYDQYVEQVEQDWLVKLRNKQLTENEIMSSTLEVDKKQEWLGYIDKQAEEILAGEDIVTDEVVKGELESMAYDIFTGAISLPDFQKELKKTRYIDKAIDDAAYDEIFSLAQREYKSYQAQALKTAVDDAARQLIDVRTEMDVFAAYEAARAKFKGAELTKETQRILSDRQLQFWNHSRYRKALNDWFAKNPDATADEIYIEAQKLLVHYRGRTIDELKKLLSEQEKRLQTIAPPAEKAGFLGRKESEFPAGFGIPKGLESIWGRLTEEEKKTARDYIKKDMPPEKIVEWFESYGNRYRFPKQVK